MAADQPDSRFMAGKQPKEKLFTREAIQEIVSRIVPISINCFFVNGGSGPALQLDCLHQMNQI